MSIRRRIWKKAGLTMSTELSLAGMAMAGALPTPTSRGGWNHTASQAHTYLGVHLQREGGMGTLNLQGLTRKKAWANRVK